MIITQNIGDPTDLPPAYTPTEKDQTVTTNGSKLSSPSTTSSPTLDKPTSSAFILTETTHVRRIMCDHKTTIVLDGLKEIEKDGLKASFSCTMGDLEAIVELKNMAVVKKRVELKVNNIMGESILRVVSTEPIRMLDVVVVNSFGSCTIEVPKAFQAETTITNFCGSVTTPDSELNAGPWPVRSGSGTTGIRDERNTVRVKNKFGEVVLNLEKQSV